MNTVSLNNTSISDKVSGEEGFTLIEILISMVIFAFGILAVASLQLNSVKGNTKSNSTTLVSSAATNIAENLRSLPFSDPDLAQGEHSAQPQGRLWVGWSVLDDMPVKPRTVDTDGNPMAPMTLSKTIRIVVFSNASGFNDKSEDNQIFTCSIVKTRYM